jgi:YjbE family integral membrane protein
VSRFFVFEEEEDNVIDFLTSPGFIAFLSIVFIDLVLAGDNAVVIAMAVRNLPFAQRKKGILLGAGAAVLLRIILTFFVAKLLTFSLIKFFGGLLLVWISLRLSMEKVHGNREYKGGKTLEQAVATLMIADLLMSVDNILAIAGASRGDPFLLIFGLGLSIPLVVFASNIFSKLIDKYPGILYIGVAILGRVAGEMIITDPWIHALIEPSKPTEYIFQAVLMGGVVGAGIFWNREKRSKRKD